jgi:hypothetical protein
MSFTNSRAQCNTFLHFLRLRVVDVPGTKAKADEAENYLGGGGEGGWQAGNELPRLAQPSFCPGQGRIASR